MIRRLMLVIPVLAVALSFATSAAAQNGPYYATPSWDQTLPCETTSNCPRFIVLANMNNEAVLDRNTGLVWQQNPFGGALDWANAQQSTDAGCLVAKNGGQ